MDWGECQLEIIQFFIAVINRNNPFSFNRIYYIITTNPSHLSPEKDRSDMNDKKIHNTSDFVKPLQPPHSSLANVTYDAFISYKHGTIDNMAAEELRNRLEHFRAPKAVSVKRHPFKRVFVDEGELSSCVDFINQIDDALKNSQWLIVICSKETPSSKWVDFEIRTFLKYHDPSRMLAILTGGEPPNCYPKGLREINGVPIEVLAADARGSNSKQILLALRQDALLKLAATMLGTPYDTLKQRHRQYLRKWIAVAACTGCIITFALGYLTAIIYAQRKNLREKQHQAKVEENIRSCDSVKNLLRRGLRKQAIETALLTVTGTDTDVFESLYALNQTLYSYECSNTFCIQNSFSPDQNIRDNVGFSPQGTYYAFLDEGNTCYVIDTNSNKLIWKINVSEIQQLENDSFFSADWISDHTLCAATKNGFVFLNVETLKITRTLCSLGDSTQLITEDPYGFNISSGNGLSVYDISLGTLLFRDGHGRADPTFGMSPDKKQLLYNSKELSVLNLANWTVTRDILGQAAENSPPYVIDACWLDSQQIAWIESRWNVKESRYCYSIVICSLENPAEKWEVESSLYATKLPYLDGHIATIHCDNDTFLLVTLGDEVSLISTKQNGLYSREIYPDFVVEAYKETDKTLLIGTCDGKLYRQEITPPLISAKNYSEAGNVSEEVHAFTYDPISKLAVLILEKDSRLIFLSPYNDPEIQPCQTDYSWHDVQYESFGNHESYRIITGILPEETSDHNTLTCIMKAGESRELYRIPAPYSDSDAVKCQKLVQQKGRMIFLYCTQTDTEKDLILHAADIETGQELYAKHLVVPFNKYSIEAAFDHQGQQLLITGSSSSKESIGYLFSTSPEEIDPVPIPFKNKGYLLSACFSPDDK